MYIKLVHTGSCSWAPGAPFVFLLTSQATGICGPESEHFTHLGSRWGYIPCTCVSLPCCLISLSCLVFFKAKADITIIILSTAGLS